jgi:flagellar protein FlbD
MVPKMITLTRLTGAQFALNPDLVERVDCTPDTVITLVDGTKYLVAESLPEVTHLVLEYRARIVAGASAFERYDATSSRRALHAVHSDDDDDAAADADAARETGTDRGEDATVVSLEPRTI